MSGVAVRAAIAGCVTLMSSVKRQSSAVIAEVRGPPLQRAGVGDEQLEAAERLGGGEHEGLERVGVGHVDGLAEGRGATVAELRDRRLDAGGVAGRDGDGAPLRGQAERDRTTDAARAARDDRALARQSQVHRPDLSSTRGRPSVTFVPQRRVRLPGREAVQRRAVAQDDLVVAARDEPEVLELPEHAGHDLTHRAGRCRQRVAASRARRSRSRAALRDRGDAPRRASEPAAGRCRRGRAAPRAAARTGAG